MSKEEKFRISLEKIEAELKSVKTILNQLFMNSTDGIAALQKVLAQQQAMLVAIDALKTIVANTSTTLDPALEKAINDVVAASQADATDLGV